MLLFIMPSSFTKKRAAVPKHAEVDVSAKMLDFYGNWNELQTLATSNNDENKRALARKTQAIFLNILPVFAPGKVSMQHPNITLKISIKK